MKVMRDGRGDVGENDDGSVWVDGWAPPRDVAANESVDASARRSQGDRAWSTASVIYGGMPDRSACLVTVDGPAGTTAA